MIMTRTRRIIAETKIGTIFVIVAVLTTAPPELSELGAQVRRDGIGGDGATEVIDRFGDLSGIDRQLGQDVMLIRAGADVAAGDFDTREFAHHGRGRCDQRQGDAARPRRDEEQRERPAPNSR